MSDDAPATWPEETIPILRTDDAARAVEWYGRLGFVEEWSHRFGPDFPAFVSIRRGDGPGVRIFLSEHRGDAEPNGLVFLRVADVESIAAEFGAEIVDQGPRVEVPLTDPDGNRIRVSGATGRAAPPDQYTYPDAD